MRKLIVAEAMSADCVYRESSSLWREVLATRFLRTLICLTVFVLIIGGMYAKLVAAEPIHFYVPFGIAIDTNNDLLVSAFIDNPTHTRLDGIFRINPTTGVGTIVSTGFDTATNIAVAPNGNIYVNDFWAHGGGINRIIQVNPLDGTQSIIVDGGIFPVGAGQLGGMAIASDGSILTTDTFPINLANGIQMYGRTVSTDPLTGSQSIIFSGPNLRLHGLSIEDDGKLVVAATQDQYGPAEILRIDPVTGTATVVSSGGNLNNVMGIALDSNGDIYVASPANLIGDMSQIVKVNPSTGVQTVFASGGLLTFPIGITISGGTLFVDDLYATGAPPVAGVAGNGAIFKFDLGTGLQTFVAFGSRDISPIPITIDIKPGSYPNSINLKSKGVVPVAVLFTEDFDASTIDPSTVKFAGASPVRWTMEDVDGDGDVDLLFHFKTQELNLTEDNTEATLTGSTYGGQPIEGTDSVNIVPQEQGKKK